LTPSISREYTDTGMFGPSSVSSRFDGYFFASAKNFTFCTSPAIVMPNVPLNAPSAVKNDDITF
jgi:hypothetical protein